MVGQLIRLKLRIIWNTVRRQTAVLVLAALGVPPAAALFVGDSDVDMLTAHNAGMRSAGAVWGFRGEEELRRAGAGILLRKPVEIVNCC